MFKFFFFAALLAFAAAKPAVYSPVVPAVSTYSAYPAVSTFGAYPAVSAYSAYSPVAAPVAYSAYPHAYSAIKYY